MNISQLETMLTISKTLSFRKAGEWLNLTQPAVSAQIKSLEDEFKVVLVDRNHPVALTDRGKVFLEHAERILAIVEELKQKLADLDHIPQGHIVLGTTASIAIQILPRVLSYFQNQFPLIKTTIMSMPSSQVLASVENGTIDVGIGYLSERSAQVETSTLYYDTFELVVSPDHPLASFDVINVGMLKDVPMILLSPDTQGRRFVDRVFGAYHIQPNVVMELGSSEEVKRMAELNLGAAVVSKLSIAAELKRGSLKMIAVREFDATHPVGVITKSGRYMNSAMRQFISDLKGMPEDQFIGSE
ncbi:MULTISPECIES: LysR family transcriptional regulator [Cohnella]|uniref:LysR family transcriptional regulator n=1 Tax=Cohnella TaxID=329857 RepID=UPI0009BA1821|nr:MULTISPECIES: LysR family transcriptional regulator [Cohnella]MBN2982902.1 LysR family transcriptional regulator [Cohnella algarum]